MSLAVLGVLLSVIAPAQGVTAKGWLVWQGAPADANGGIAALSASNVWVMGNLYGSHGLLSHWNGSSWEPTLAAPAPGPGTSVLTSIAAASASDVWVAGRHVAAGTEATLIDHYDGTSWNTQATPDPGTSESLNGIAASSASNAWAVGSYFNASGNGGNGSYDALPLHNDGTGWAFVGAWNSAVFTEFDAVATLSSGDAWAVGRAATGPGYATEPLVEHWNGSVWSTSFSPTSGFDGGVLTAVYEQSPTNVWAVGSDGNSGLVEHWDGLSWQRVTLPAGPGGTPSYATVSGSGAGNVWIGGSFSRVGFVWHWNGASWSIAPTPGPSGSGLGTAISSVSVLDDSTAFAQAGSSPFGGFLLRYGTGDFSSAIEAFRPDRPTVELGAAEHLTGILAFSEQASSWGETVHVDRTNPDNTHTTLADATVDNEGRFGFDDAMPSQRGTYTYTATYAGSASRSGASAQTTVKVQGRATTLTLSPSRSIIGYGQSVTLTAHLTGHGSNAAVSIYQAGSAGAILVASGPVDADGNLTATLAPAKNTTFRASYDGDSTSEPAASSDVPVSVRVAISGAQSGYYKRAGSYALFHFRTACPRKGEGCPRYTTAVAPTKAGKRVAVTLQVYLSHAWRPVGTAYATLGPKSKATLVLVYANSTKLIGNRFRERSLYPGDNDHGGSLSAWTYFKITR